MKSWLNYIICGFFLLAGCAPQVKYIEKQSEGVSKAVWAVGDSLEARRIDLAQKYSEEARVYISAPQVRIPIKSIYRPPIITDGRKSAPGTDIYAGKRILVVPEGYEEQVIVVNSSEYETLIKNTEVADQLFKENQTLTFFNKQALKDKEIQNEVHDKLLKDYNTSQADIVLLKEEIKQKNVSLWCARACVIGLLTGAGVLLFLKFKGLFLL